MRKNQEIDFDVPILMDFFNQNGYVVISGSYSDEELEELIGLYDRVDEESLKKPLKLEDFESKNKRYKYGDGGKIKATKNGEVHLVNWFPGVFCEDTEKCLFEPASKSLSHCSSFIR